jgi:hypothetical protein
VPGSSPDATICEQRIITVERGQPLPAGWRLVRLLGTQMSIWFPSGCADVILVERPTTDGG